jgi:hypothetical protein
MNFRTTTRLALLGSVLVAGAASPATAGTAVSTINAALIGAIQAQAQKPPPAARNIALVSISVYDAVNAATGLRGESYAYGGGAVWSANADAAAYAAGFTVLSALYPTMAAGFQTQMNSAIDGLGLNAARRAASISLGSNIATSFVNARASDGSAVAQIPFVPDGSLGGYVSVNSGDPVLPGWGQVTPFAMASNDAVAPPPPPPVGSAEWRASYEDVKSVGCMGCGTPEQLETAVFWADDGGGTRTPPGQWLQIATNIADDRNLDVFEAARLSAMVGTSLADASFAAWNVKYDQSPIWRPVTAIRECTMALCGVEGDPTWTPMIPTPNFPAYVSGHSTMGGAGERAISGYFGTDAVSFCLDPDPQVASLPTRCYTSLAAAEDENGISRIYGGVHWSYDNIYGKMTGRSVGDYVAANYFGINAVPEPASWAMLIAGFGLTGAAMRRRRVAAA